MEYQNTKIQGILLLRDLEVFSWRSLGYSILGIGVCERNIVVLYGCKNFPYNEYFSWLSFDNNRGFSPFGSFPR